MKIILYIYLNLLLSNPNNYGGGNGVPWSLIIIGGFFLYLMLGSNDDFNGDYLGVIII